MGPFNNYVTVIGGEVTGCVTERSQSDVEKRYEGEWSKNVKKSVT